MQAKDVDAIIRALEDVKARPSAYMMEGAPQIFAFLAGFNLACLALDVPDDKTIIPDEILIQRGWHPSSLAPLKEMKERGWTEQEIGLEMLTLSIENWRQRR